MAKEAMKWHLDYLAALKAAVQDAHAKGKTLNRAQSHADLPAFKGYAIYDWVPKASTFLPPMRNSGSDQLMP